MTTPTYSDDEIFALMDLQLGAPPVSKPSQHGVPIGNQGEGEYYNSLTEWLYRMLAGDLRRVKVVREAFYRKHNIIAFDALSNAGEFKTFLKPNKDGSVTFLSDDFDNSKTKR